MIDVGTFAGLAALTLLLVEGIKLFWTQTFFYVLQPGQVRLITWGVGIALGIAAKASGMGYSELSWGAVSLNTLVAIIAAQGAYSGVLKPVKKQVGK